MKILTSLLVVACPCLALAASSSSVSRDGGHGGAAHPPQSQGSGHPPSSSYEGPPPPYDPSLYEPQPPRVPAPQFQYHSFQPNYLEPAWQPQESGGLSTWLDKGLAVLGEVLPVALSVVCILAILTFLGLVKIPVITSVSEAREQIGRALASVDVDQLANTVHLAIDKYHELFGSPDVY